VRSFLGHVAVAAALGALTLGLYASTADFPFVFDDLQNIRDNPHIRAEQLSWDALWRAATHGPTKRPVAYVSFALSHRVGGLEPAAYRWGNIAVHAVCGWLVYLLALRLLALHGRLSDQSAPHSFAKTRVAVALLTAAIFVAHPLQTQSVTYIVQRMASLSALFSLVSLLCWLAGRVRSGGPRRWFWAAAFASWLLALLSKENAATLPVVVLLIEWFFLRDLDPAWLRRHAVAIGAVAAVGLGLGVAYLTVWTTSHGWELYGFTPVERMLSESRVLWRYLALVALPLPSWQNLGHEVAISRSLLEPPTTLVAGAGLALLFAGLVATARRRRLVAFCGLWFFVNLAVESTFVPLALMWEHRLYLPLVGPALLVSHTLFGFRPRTAPWAVAVGMALVALLATGTALRNPVWRDEVALWSDVTSKSPGDARAWNNLGAAFTELDRNEEALEFLQTAIALDPSYPEARVTFAVALIALGRIDAAETQLRRALEIAPSNVKALSNLGQLLQQRGQLEAALGHLRTAVRYDPSDATAQLNLANVLLRVGRRDEALQYFGEAARLDPENPKPLAGAAWILATHPDPNTRNPAEAVRLAERAAARSTRSDPIVLSTLATAYDAAGHRDRAISAAERALQRATELGATRDAQRIRAQLKHYRANAARSASP
jgi:tetratricopeptide (TPR) repeat protein